MDERRRLTYYILLNVIVSAVVTWIVLTIWIRSNPFPEVVVESPLENLSTEQAVATSSTPESTTESDPVLAGEAAQGQLEISSIVGAGDLDNERVSVRHVGQFEVTLTAWELRDENGNAYIFPTLRMFPGGAVTIHTIEGVDNVNDLYWGGVRPVWKSRETATLVDPEGHPQATYSVP